MSDKMKNVNADNLATFADCLKTTINSMEYSFICAQGQALSSIVQEKGKIVATVSTDTIDKANKWTTSRYIEFTGDVTGKLENVNGSSNYSVALSVVDDSHNHTISNIDNLQTQLDERALIGHDHDDRYVKLSGSTMTGILNGWSNQYQVNSTSIACALDLKNSNIVGINGLWFADACDSSSEGIHFMGSNATTWHTLATNAAGVLTFAIGKTQSTDNLTAGTTTMSLSNTGVLAVRSLTTSTSHGSTVTASISSAGYGQFTQLRVGSTGSNIVKFYKSNSIIYVD